MLDDAKFNFIVLICLKILFPRTAGGAGYQRRLREIADLEARAQGILDDIARRTGGAEGGGEGAQEKAAAMWGR